MSYRMGLVLAVVVLVVVAAIPVVARQATTGTPAASPTASTGETRCDDAADATPIAATPDGATPAATSVARSIGPVYTTGPVTIQLTDEGFVPDRVLSAVGHDLTVTLVNTGTRAHNFCIEDLNVDILLEPGETTTVELNDLPLGEYPFVSDLRGDEALQGRLTIFI